MEIITINRRQYRKTIIKPPTGVRRGAQTNEDIEEFKKDDGLSKEEEALLAHNLDIYFDKVENRFTLRLNIDKMFYPFLIGKNRATLTRLQKDTGAFLRIPTSSSLVQEVVITGEREKDVALCKLEIDKVLTHARKKLSYSHFISFPLISEKLQEKFSEFKEEVLKLYGGEHGMDSSLFMKSEMLHVTGFMLKLFSPDEIKSAKNLLASPQLQEEIKTITKGKDLSINLDGLAIMNDDPTQVDVLYAKLAESRGLETIRQVCDVLIRAFHKAKLLSEDEIVKQQLVADEGSEEKVIERKLNIKFHATLLNTKYRTETRRLREELKKAKGPEQFPERTTFDATLLLEKFENINFGKQVIPAVHLSNFTVIDHKTGYYRAEAMLPFLGKET